VDLGQRVCLIPERETLLPGVGVLVPEPLDLVIVLVDVPGCVGIQEVASLD
jgi:hypothetical protein